VIALFEIDPVFVDGQPGSKGNLAKVNVRYELPNDTLQRFTAYKVPYSITPFITLPAAYRFASSVAMFAALLKDSKYARNYSWSEVIKLATESQDPQDAIQKEFITIIEKAKKIYSRMRKKRKSS
jgi:Ca-activated chloride channel family protein